MPGMNHSPDLHESLNRMAEMLPRDASAATEERLLLAFRTQRRTRRMWRYAGSAAICGALGFGLFLARHSGRMTHVTPVNESSSGGTTGFVALPYAESGVPMEDAIIVRLRLRASELGRLGVPVGASTTNERISADLLVGQDGVARAVRLVQ